MTCGCLGCREDATTRIDHPRHGERVVCDSHAEGFQTLGFTGGEVA
jgi:hypothetical protein